MCWRRPGAAAAGLAAAGLAVWRVACSKLLDRTFSSQPRLLSPARSARAHIRNTSIMNPNMSASPATHMIAPAQWMSCSGFGEPGGAGPSVARSGVPWMLRISPVNVSTGMATASIRNRIG